MHSQVDVWRKRNGRGGGDDEDDGAGGANRDLLRQAAQLYTTAKARKTAAEAQLLELKVQERNREVVTRDEVTAELDDVFAFLRDGLRRLPDDAANEVPADYKPTVIALLRRNVDKLLTEFANKASRIGD